MFIFVYRELWLEQVSEKPLHGWPLTRVCIVLLTSSNQHTTSFIFPSDMWCTVLVKYHVFIDADWRKAMSCLSGHSVHSTYVCVHVYCVLGSQSCMYTHNRPIDYH